MKNTEYLKTIAEWLLKTADPFVDALLFVICRNQLNAEKVMSEMHFAI